MIARFKLFAATALGLALATGAVADASAKTAAPRNTPAVHAPASPHKIHRLPLAHAARAHKGHVAHRAAARHKAEKHLARTGGPRGTTQAGRATRQHQAMAHHAGGKTTLTR